MTEQCPECNSELIELGTKGQTYTLFTHYGYWCRFCKKMYVKKHKSWIEPWKYNSLQGSKINED